MEQNVTKNITAKDEILEVLQKYFSQCFDKDNNFNFEKFKKELQLQDVNFSKESYTLDWLGKSYARLLATDSATTLLKEDKEWNNKGENKTSQNLLIKGDNLEVLKHLSNAYYNKIKMIYIDPPYNTGNDDFVYQDDRKFTVEELSKLAGIDDEKAKRILDFVNSKSNSHSAWLTFMYPRLYIARRLLRDDGVIFVSIDDNEVAQLRILMDEIFGEENFVAQISVINNLKGRSDDKFFATCNEYLLVYAKNIDDLKVKGFELTEEEIEDEYSLEDECGKYKITGFRKTGKGWRREERPFMYYPILEKNNKFFAITDMEYKLIYNSQDNKFNDEAVDEIKKKYESQGYTVYLPVTTNNEKGRWRWGFKEYKRRIDDITLNSNNSPCVKERPFLEDGTIREKLAKTTWYKGEYDTGSSGKYLKKFFGKNNDLFENPKSVIFIKDILKITTNRNDIILDFFAGSGTTGDAVMQLNAEDVGNRKYILVQIPEYIDPDKKKEAYNFVKNELGVEKPTIFEITKERLVRAARKIKEEIIDKKIAEIEIKIKELEAQSDLENNQKEIERFQKEINVLKNQDLGFKIFETVPIWEGYEFKAEVFEEQLNLFDENKLTEEDIQMLLTTWKTYDGVPLTQDLNAIDLDGYTGYYHDTKIYLMFKGFEIKHLKKLLEEIDTSKDFNPATIIVFGYNFDSKTLREIAENVSSYMNKKSIDIDFIIRY